MDKEVLEARKNFLSTWDGQPLYMRNNETETLFYKHSSWLVKNVNQKQLDSLQVGQIMFNSNKTKITRIF